MTVPPIHLISRALRMDEQRTAALANNIANISTDGFKPEMVAQQWLAGENGPRLVASRDLRQGALQVSESPADLALDGQGFLVVETPAGERLTRGGRILRRPEDGVVVDAHGSPILGLVRGVPQQRMVAPDGPMQVSPDGLIRVGDVAVGQLQAVWPADPQRLLRGAQGYFEAETPTAPQRGVRFLQGHREQSGADHLTSMVELLEVQKRHGSKMEILRALDGMLETSTTSIGRLP